MSSWPETRHSLIRRLANAEDAAGWAEFEQAYRPTIYRYVRGRGLQASDALDAVQEVMLAVHKQAATWEPSGRTGSFRAWLAETARLTTLQLLRMRSRTSTEDTAYHAAAGGLAGDPSPSSEEAEEQRWLFCQAAAHVEAHSSPGQWRAFWRTAVDGVSPDAVAHELGMNVGAVYTARSRIQSRLRSRIESMTHDEGAC